MRIFVGHDSRQPENTQACVESIKQFGHEVILLDRAQLQSEHGYSRDEDGSTEFTYTRFLVPYLCNYQGGALFCDGDFIWRKDPAKILLYIKPDVAVNCVKHLVKQVREDMKFSKHKNEWYPRKWWSSLMYFDCSHPHLKQLTVECINEAEASWLHRMHWTGEVGGLPETFNYLVGYYSFLKDPVAVHFTDGTPLYGDYATEEFAEDYNDFRRF